MALTCPKSKLDKAAVFGRSIHSYIALEYARTFTQNTSHVVMSGFTPYSLAGVADEFWESYSTGSWRRLDTTALPPVRIWQSGAGKRTANGEC